MTVIKGRYQAGIKKKNIAIKVAEGSIVKTVFVATLTPNSVLYKSSNGGRGSNPGADDFGKDFKWLQTLI